MVHGPQKSRQPLKGGLNTSAPFEGENEGRVLGSGPHLITAAAEASCGHPVTPRDSRSLSKRSPAVNVDFVAVCHAQSREEKLMVFLVTYDLVQPGQEYPNLIAELQRVGAVRLQKSVWLLEASLPAERLCDILQSYMDPNDRLFVVSIESGNYNWAGRNMLAPSGEWLKKRRP